MREIFEKFVLDYDYLIPQIFEKHRSVQVSYKHISKVFQDIVAHLKNGKDIGKAIEEITSTSSFNYLNIRPTSQQINVSEKDFNTNKKSEIYIREALQKAPSCKICNGLIHKNSISIDHIQRKQDGGLATLDNGQLTHPYCNTGYKN